MKKLKCKLRIGAYSGSGTGFHITIVDETSGVQVAELRMTYEEFGTVLANREIKCDYEFNAKAVSLVDGKAQNKTEHIRIKTSDIFDTSRRKVKLAVKKLEVDGWKARHNDIENHHCYSRVDDTYTDVAVSFFRIIPPKGD